MRKKNSAAEQYHELKQSAANHLDLANTYLEDGALITAAQHLLSAASKLIDAHGQRQIALSRGKEAA